MLYVFSYIYNLPLDQYCFHIYTQFHIIVGRNVCFENSLIFQVLVDYQLDSILNFAVNPNLESDAFPHFVEHSSRLCGRQPDLAHRVALDMPRQLLSQDLDLPAQGIFCAVLIVRSRCGFLCFCSRSLRKLPRG